MKWILCLSMILMVSCTHHYNHPNRDYHQVEVTHENTYQPNLDVTYENTHQPTVNKTLPNRGTSTSAEITYNYVNYWDSNLNTSQIELYNVGGFVFYRSRRFGVYGPYNRRFYNHAHRRNYRKLWRPGRGFRYYRPKIRRNQPRVINTMPRRHRVKPRASHNPKKRIFKKIKKNQRGAYHSWKSNQQPNHVSRKKKNIKKRRIKSINTNRSIGNNRGARRNQTRFNNRSQTQSWKQRGKNFKNRGKNNTQNFKSRGRNIYRNNGFNNRSRR